MSRTDLDAATLARSLRRMAGDGGMEWCCEPIRASVLLDVADMLDENAKLRELVRDMMAFVDDDEACEHCGHDVECVDAAQGELVLPYEGQCLMRGVFHDRMRELGVDDG